MRTSKSSPAKKSGRELAETAKAMLKQDKKIPVKTVDCTPDWVGLVPLFVDWIQNGNPQQYEEAQKNIRQMAMISDSYRKNKSLFMASEDMLDALKAAAFIFKKEYGYKPEAEPTVGSRWYESVVNAIAKAEGKQ